MTGFPGEESLGSEGRGAGRGGWGPAGAVSAARVGRSRSPVGRGGPPGERPARASRRVSRAPWRPAARGLAARGRAVPGPNSHPVRLPSVHSAAELLEAVLELANRRVEHQTCLSALLLQDAKQLVRRVSSLRVLRRIDSHHQRRQRPLAWEPRVQRTARATRVNRHLPVEMRLTAQFIRQIV